MSDLLDLDAILGAGATTAVTAPAEPVAPVAAAEVTAPVAEAPKVEAAKEEPKAVEHVVDFSSFDFGDLPAMHRVGGGNFAKRGSKYGFDLFPAPNAEGKPAMKLIPFGDKKDEVSRQVQSAVTAANRASIKEVEAAKAKGEVVALKKFQTRTGADRNGVAGIFIARTQ